MYSLNFILIKTNFLIRTSHSLSQVLVNKRGVETNKQTNKLNQVSITQKHLKVFFDFFKSLKHIFETDPKIFSKRQFYR